MSDNREYPSAPIVGVGAIVFQDNNVLLVRRGREPLKGEWSLPGGRLELGESLQEGVAREVREETGLTVVPLRHVETLDRVVRDRDGRVLYHYVLVDYLCELRGGVLECDDDAMDVAWVPVANLRSPEIAIAEFTLTVLEKALLLR
ncbi:NUDIX hydrolase [Terriglobus tenax]|uniref:NUDIX hydrolase n=1 Tax=Terriglobus tenax TaxID=1111115 RepID=UPI0021E0B4BE|nr:NUDIX hydrolase [Terriglobus tenax]